MQFKIQWHPPLLLSPAVTNFIRTCFVLFQLLYVWPHKFYHTVKSKPTAKNNEVLLTAFIRKIVVLPNISLLCNLYCYIAQYIRHHLVLWYKTSKFFFLGYILFSYDYSMCVSYKKSKLMRYYIIYHNKFTCHN